MIKIGAKFKAYSRSPILLLRQINLFIWVKREIRSIIQMQILKNKKKTDVKVKKTFPNVDLYDAEENPKRLSYTRQISVFCDNDNANEI